MSKDPSKLDRIILAQCLSTSGKYQLFLAEHILHGKFCYDVAALNKETGLIVSRHYNLSKEDSVNKAEALRIYDQYRENLQAPAKPQEGDDNDPLIYIEPN